MIAIRFLSVGIALVLLVASAFAELPPPSAGSDHACAAALVDDAKSADGESAESLIERLRKLPPGWYYDMHGNAHDQVRALLRRRFAVTEAVCKEIDRATPKGPHRYVRMLYYCLGYVKDPASIPWLENKIRRGEPSLIYEQWLSDWDFFPGAAPHSRIKWLKTPDR
jgi:hypothetical protein